MHEFQLDNSPKQLKQEILKQHDRNRKAFALTAITSLFSLLITVAATRHFGIFAGLCLATGALSGGGALYFHNDRKKKVKAYQIPDNAKTLWSFSSLLSSKENRV